MEADGPDDAPFDAPLDAVTVEPAAYSEGKASVLTPMGQVESLGGFAGGLGRRRVKILLAAFGACVLLLAVVEAAA